MMDERGRIRSFKDLEVYQNAYRGVLLVHREIVPKLPREEDCGLKDQLRRATKAVPRLIAEGHSERHQKRGFQKHIDDAGAESNETTAFLEQARDLYPEHVHGRLCGELVDLYDKISRQLHNLAVTWQSFGRRDPASREEAITSSSSPDPTVPVGGGMPTGNANVSGNQKSGS